MPLSRLLVLITGLVILLGMALWLVDALQRLFFYVAYLSPILAGLLTLLVIVLFGLLIFAFLYYANLIRMPSRFTAKRIPPEVPKAKAEAAIERRFAMAEQKIAQAEAKALSDIKSHAADLAVAAAETVLKDGVKGDSAVHLIDQSIKSLKGQLH